MKKLNLLFLAIFTMAIVSCSSDDDNGGSNTTGDLLGTWVGQTVNYSGSTVTTFQGQNITADFVGEGYDVDYTLTFSENPNEVTSNGSYSIELTTTIAGQSTTQNEENIQFLETSDWAREGDQLTITTNGESTTGTIQELTATSLVLAIDTVEQTSEQGIDTTVTINAVSTYTRQ